MKNKCKFCGKEIKEGQRYCNVKCANKWYYRNSAVFRERIKRNARRYYNKHKKNPKWKKKQYAEWKAWADKNREKVNAYYRERYKRAKSKVNSTR